MQKGREREKTHMHKKKKRGGRRGERRKETNRQDGVKEEIANLVGKGITLRKNRLER